jgi:hypothetical protein
MRKGRFTSHVNGMTSDGQNSVAAIVHMHISMHIPQKI